MLKKQNRLGKITKKKEDKLFSFPLFSLRVSDNGEKTTRFAFIVSKKIDKRAVIRNRTKRVLRGAVEEIAEKVKGGKNVIIVSKKALAPNQKEEIFAYLQGVFKKTGILE